MATEAKMSIPPRSPLARSALSPLTGERRRGGNHEGRGGVLPPTLTLPRKGGGDRLAGAA